MTADQSAAADTLRDELAHVLFVKLPIDADLSVELADAMLPKALAYTDAQVAAERERITAELEAEKAAYSFAVFPPISRSDTHRAQAALEAIGLTLDRFSAQAIRARIGTDARIVRGQP